MMSDVMLLLYLPVTDEGLKLFSHYNVRVRVMNQVLFLLETGQTLWKTSAPPPISLHECKFWVVWSDRLECLHSVVWPARVCVWDRGLTQSHRTSNCHAVNQKAQHCLPRQDMTSSSVTLRKTTLQGENSGLWHFLVMLEKWKDWLSETCFLTFNLEFQVIGFTDDGACCGVRQTYCRLCWDYCGKSLKNANLNLIFNRLMCRFCHYFTGNYKVLTQTI